MKHLFTLAFLALLTVASVPNAQAQQPAAKPAKAAAAKPKPASKWSTEQIKDAQTGLQKAKLYKGKITGTWTAETMKSFRAWQKANGMAETGQLTDETLAKLKSA